MTRLVFSGFAMVLLLPLSSSAAPAITCHCFTDRLYDSSRPSLADPYFLATAQNSFFAAFFNVDKKKIVMKKQTGSSADDLWVAYWVAAKTGGTGEALLALRGKMDSWKEVVIPLGLSAELLGERFSAEVTARASAPVLAREIVDYILLKHGLLVGQDLATLRKEWASNQEVILTSMIAVRIRRSPLWIYREVKKGTKSWGAFLSEAKIQPSAFQSEFVTLLK